MLIYFRVIIVNINRLNIKHFATEAPIVNTIFTININQEYSLAQQMYLKIVRIPNKKVKYYTSFRAIGISVARHHEQIVNR